MAMMKTYKNVDEYIKNSPVATQNHLKSIRKVVTELAPDAKETISYGIPTLKLNGNLIHFAGYEHHIGFYPGSEAIEMFKKDLSKYNTSKGTVQFPLDKPMPLSLIKKITKFRIEKNKNK